jgi:hypothetical protein
VMREIFFGSRGMRSNLGKPTFSQPALQPPLILASCLLFINRFENRLQMKAYFRDRVCIIVPLPRCNHRQETLPSILQAFYFLSLEDPRKRWLRPR